MSKTPLTVTEITELTVGLNQLARNLWWTWDFAQRVLAVLINFHAYLYEKKTWGREHAPALVEHPVAYFSAEFGFHETLPIAAGGLGVLAGDHAKSASDLGLGFVGISLFYREGYFMQTINQDNWQSEYYTLLTPKNLPIEPVLDAKGDPLVCSVEIAMNQVYFHAWRVNVGRCPVYLLDTNRPENEQLYRDLTLRVYGGDSTTRIMQEILLGIGGVRLLRALGVQPSVFHMNEGHAAFLVFELIREKIAEGKSFEELLAATKHECIFTTHTPVEAGHDRFSRDLVNYALHKIQKQLKLSLDGLMALGRLDPKNQSEPFCMTVLALKASRGANGVSELHGRVSRQMWHCLYPDKAVEDVPIGHITNGVHLLGWMKGPVRRFWRRKLTGTDSAPEDTLVTGDTTTFSRRRTSDNWEQIVNDPVFLERMADPDFIADEELWALRYKLRRELLEFCRRRLLIQGQRLTQGDFIAFDHLLNPDALTIGFARRFATYKRAPLIFKKFENIVKLVNDRQRPLQFIFAGKAHPRDEDGKRFIQHIIHLSKYSELKGHLVFIENYDVHVARQMASGCDVWLNNPRRPLEASGTSGMKASCHGCLNFSILDGWWREGYDGTNGFAIGDDSHPDSVEEQDRCDSENLYKTLTEEVIPCFFNRDAHGIPRQWIQKIRRAMVTLVPQFNTWRMVKEYTTKYYVTR